MSSLDPLITKAITKAVKATKAKDNKALTDLTLKLLQRMSEENLRGSDLHNSLQNIFEELKEE